jgi:membrane dipeptidase
VRAAEQKRDGLDRRQLLRGALLAGASAVAAPMLNFGRCRLYASQAIDISTVAADLVLSTTVIDMLGLLTLDWPKLYAWQKLANPFKEADFRAFERSAIDVIHPAVETKWKNAFAGAVHWLAGWNRLLAPGRCFLARIDAARELRRARAAGTIGVIAGFQDSDHFRSAGDVAVFHGMGQRVSQLTYNTHNRLGSGCYEPVDNGLTPFGAEIVRAMNETGMAIDVSHCGERTSRDAIAASRKPVLITHANCRALAPRQPRNKSDALIRRMAAGGGVMGITMVRAFAGGSSPTIDDVLDHFDHVARLVGVEHVGLGSDLDTAARDPKSGGVHAFYAIRGLDPEVRVFQIADGLLARGYRREDVRLVLGGNFARALGEIWGDAPSARGRQIVRDPFCPAARPATPRATASG